jgi:hypothetical protein
MAGSQSMVGDLFDKNEHPRAPGVYAIGASLSVFLRLKIYLMANDQADHNISVTKAIQFADTL